MLYTITIIVCMAIIAASNALFLPAGGYGWFELSVWTVVCTLSAIAIDGILAAIVRRLFPEKWFAIDKKVFCATKKEMRFYEKIGIKAWKEKVLELGIFTSFSKKEVSQPHNNDYVARYILEANYGIVCHLADVIIGSACVIFCCPVNLWLTVGIPVAGVNAVLNALPIFILRYNLPKLHVLYKFNQRRIESQEKAS